MVISHRLINKVKTLRESIICIYKLQKCILEMCNSKIHNVHKFSHIIVEGFVLLALSLFTSLITIRGQNIKDDIMTDFLVYFRRMF